MTSFQHQGSYFQDRELNANNSSAIPWYIEDNLSDCSLLPSPICDDVVTPPSLDSSFNGDDTFNPLTFCQAQDWLYDNELDFETPDDMAVKPSALKQITVTQQPTSRLLDRRPEPFVHTQSNNVADQDFGLVLPPAEFRRLTAIAMGEAVRSPSPSSPASDDSEEQSQPSAPSSRRSSKYEVTTPPPSKKRGRPSRNSTSKRRMSKSSHNQVEKKYRTNLNAKIAQLRDCLPELRVQRSDIDDEQAEDRHISKAMILAQAVECITNLKQSLNDQEQEIQVLKSVVRMYQPTFARAT